jgi:hypothetical protein
VGSFLKGVENLDLSKNYINIKDQINKGDIKEPLDLSSIYSIDKIVKQDTDFGVMLYYGGSKTYKNLIYKEKSYQM